MAFIQPLAVDVHHAQASREARRHFLIEKFAPLSFGDAGVQIADRAEAKIELSIDPSARVGGVRCVCREGGGGRACCWRSGAHAAGRAKNNEESEEATASAHRRWSINGIEGVQKQRQTRAFSRCGWVAKKPITVR